MKKYIYLILFITSFLSCTKSELYIIIKDTNNKNLENYNYEIYLNDVLKSESKVIFSKSINDFTRLKIPLIDIKDSYKLSIRDKENGKILKDTVLPDNHKFIYITFKKNDDKPKVYLLSDTKRIKME
ncbi:hypothetical protein [Aquimarina sp. Aq78]|uniref:hypothetical protein n=1 Tax=Aquimarina sp. Aq78 TaxID=1191889 RepID=UPI000D110ABA|nr:hypothetical protein [Aquimarina sp. Aq78]